jgi:hypothetical protein
MSSSITVRIASVSVCLCHAPDTRDVHNTVRLTSSGHMTTPYWLHAVSMIMERSRGAEVTRQRRASLWHEVTDATEKSNLACRKNKTSEHCAVLCHYGASGSNSLPEIRDNLLVTCSTGRLSRNSGKILLTLAAFDSWSWGRYVGPKRR